jgi:hypothetical protein
MATRARITRRNPKPGEPKTYAGRLWRARVKVMGQDLFLGNFETREEAEAEEAAYRAYRQAQQIKQGVAHG